MKMNIAQRLFAETLQAFTIFGQLPIDTTFFFPNDKATPCVKVSNTQYRVQENPADRKVENEVVRRCESLATVQPFYTADDIFDRR